MRLMLQSVAVAQLEKKAASYAKYVKKLNARSIAGTNYKIGSLIEPIFKACSESKVVRESPNPEVETLKCAIDVMQLAILYLKSEV